MYIARFENKLTHAVRELSTLIADNGAIMSKGVIEGTYSQEAFGTFDKAFDESVRAPKQQLKHILGELSPEFSLESDRNVEESIRAGLIAMLAGSQYESYSRESIRGKGMFHEKSLESLNSGRGGLIDSINAKEITLEAFDNTKLDGFTAMSVIFNVLASRQDEFAEAFFPTKVITAAEGGIEIRVDQQVVRDFKTHNTDGSTFDVGERNLVEGFTDPRLLNRPTTEIIPWANADGSVDKFFVDEADVASRMLNIGKTTIQTRPLKMGVTMDLLGLSQHPGQLDNNRMDNTDQIAPGASLAALYLKLDGGGSTEIIRIPVNSMGRSLFRQAHEGGGRETVLNFYTEGYPIGPATKTIAGTTSALLKTAVVDTNLVAQLTFHINGHLELDKGTLTINAGALNVAKVINDIGESVALDAGAGKAVVDAFATLNATFIGYDLSARRSNSNWRTIGVLIDVTPMRESYAVEPGYPISVLTPIGDVQDGSKISGMVNAARIRNSNQAITTLFNYSEQLRAWQDATNRGVKLGLIGAGRHIVKPTYVYDEIDVEATVISMTSTGRPEDIATVIVSAIRDIAYRMYKDSGYGPALSMVNAGTQVKPKLVIGCDAVVARHLTLKANERLMGEHLDYKVVQTNDMRMADTVFVTFTTDRPGSDDGLGFGVHAYIPELIQRSNTSHNNETKVHDRVIPRSRHIPVLPVIAELKILKLKEAVRNTGP